MPVNFQKIRKDIEKMGMDAINREKVISERCDDANVLITQYCDKFVEVNQLIDRVVAKNSWFRCARPTAELMNDKFDSPTLLVYPLIIAADGSQIIPSRHDAVQFGLINIGVFRIQTGSGKTPEVSYDSELIFGDALYQDGYMVGEDFISLKRDLAERQALNKAVRLEENKTVIALTDGQLELFRGESKENARFNQVFNQYLEALRELSVTGAITAGYVDRPRADLVVRMLELLVAVDSENVSAERPFEGVSDFNVFSRILKPGQRSAIFEIQSGSSVSYSDELALHFFYLNVGRENKPWIARIEIPRWVAVNEQKVKILQAALLEQCRRMGLSAYPYCLHRAHEIAVVDRDQKAEIEGMIISEMIRQGLTPGETSYKQAAKDLPGRTRLER